MSLRNIAQRSKSFLMPETRFLSIEVVLAIHHSQINVFGGLHGLRDQGLLESAVDQAHQTFSHSNDIFQTAAQYCLSIAKNHPFLDGNKRTAAACMLTFMVLNGFEPTLSNQDLFDWTLKVAIGELSRDQLAELLLNNSSTL
ncbi:MAG: type II toxin-antitoxin system death-on-curing family toxin [Gammaproteobacteria bacterium]|nr:type II toxin-antitoxin system death-on-curing family toxin [Gammaproteobacteria bacterium]